jgi:hypothetical protein
MIFLIYYSYDVSFIVYFEIIHSLARYFPNSTKAGWEANYSDFLFAAIQMNLFTLYHELHDLGEKELTLEGFTELLVDEIISLIVVTERRTPQRGFKRDTKY